MADAIKIGLGGGNNIANKNTEPYSFEFARKPHISMSALYNNGETTMEEVMDYMLNNDTSGVFDFDSETLIALQNKSMIIRFFVSVSKESEREFGTETFALLTASKLSRFCKGNHVKIRIEAKYVVGETLASRKTFGWK